MFSQIFRFFALPSNLLVLLGILGFLLALTRRKRLGQGMMAVSLFALAIAGWSPLGNWLMSGLENRFAAWDFSHGAPDGIVVLGGAISPEISSERASIALNEAAERMTVMADLARRFPSARIVFSGGSGRFGGGGVPEANFVLPLFESFGIARERVLLEALSRNTAENARLTKELVRPKIGERWLLVTSAYHMPRAMSAFRGAGFDVEAYPVDWRSGTDDSAAFSSLSAGLARTDTALREWVGLFGYWLTGQSSELWPGP